MFVLFPHKTLNVFACILIYALAFSANAEEVKVDYMSLTALMIKEGDYVRAGEAIEKVDQKDEKLDRKRFYTLHGIISLNKELYSKSIGEFDSAIAAGQENKIIHVYLAQAYMGLEKYEQALSHLSKTGDLETTMAALKEGDGALGRLLVGEEGLDELQTAFAAFGQVSEGKGTIGRLLADETLYDEVRLLVYEVRAAVDDFRETAPITLFTSIFFGAF